MRQRFFVWGGIAVLALTMNSRARAEDLGTDIRDDRGKIQDEKSDIRNDRRELRGDLERGDTGAAAAERRDVRKDERQLHHDRADLKNDEREARNHHRR